MTQQKPYDRHLGYRQSLIDIGPRFLLRTSLMLRLLRGEHGNLLDIGCGDGFFMEKLIARGFECTGLDPSARACELCQNRVGPLGGRVYCTDVQDFEPDAPFSVVTCGEVLEHVEDDEHMLAQAYRLLRPGGALVLSVPLDMRLWNEADVRAGHKRRYTRDEILTKVKDTGFEIEKYIVWGYPTTRMAHFWIRRRQDKLMASPSVSGDGSQPHSGLLRLRPILRLARYLFMIDNLFNFTEKGVGIVVKSRRPAESRKPGLERDA